MNRKRLRQLIDSLAANRKLGAREVETQLERELKKIAEDLINENKTKD